MTWHTTMAACAFKREGRPLKSNQAHASQAQPTISMHLPMSEQEEPWSNVPECTLSLSLLSAGGTTQASMRTGGRASSRASCSYSWASISRNQTHFDSAQLSSVEGVLKFASLRKRPKRVRYLFFPDPSPERKKTIWFELVQVSGHAEKMIISGTTCVRCTGGGKTYKKGKHSPWFIKQNGNHIIKWDFGDNFLWYECWSYFLAHQMYDVWMFEFRRKFKILHFEYLLNSKLILTSMTKVE